MYEKKSLFRFLTLYLVSVFMLLLVIGYLFFENNRASMKNSMKFEMMYEARMLSGKIAMKAMKDDKNGIINKNIEAFLKKLKHSRFEVGFYDANKVALYTQINTIPKFDTEFFMDKMQCYARIEDKSEHLGIRYVVLKEHSLANTLHELRLKIISYLLLSFIVMGIVGYFLGKLFLRPVREQIESLDKFISDTTHELNTPISAILMTIQSLKNIEVKKLKRLESSAKRLSIMYSTLTYRLEGNIEVSQSLCFADIIKSRVDYVREIIDSKHLNISLDLEPTEVFMSKLGADRLIDNLLSNAIKYSDKDDSIELNLKNNILIVKDTGIGIDIKVQNDIFKRYHRGNEERGGFGIGLNIVLSICKKYNIKLALESEKGEGSQFILTFPKIQK